VGGTGRFQASENNLVRSRRWLRRPRLGIGPQLVIVLLVLGLIGAMAIQPTRALLEQRRRIDTMAGDLQRIEGINSKLEARIERLQDPDFIEQEARAKVGLVRAGETTYIVMPPSRQRQRRAKAKAETKPETPRPDPPPGIIEGFLDFVGLG
jgi:cell division protein FtsB